jgi:predicted nucleic acid-binding Zn ribbon protein
MPTYLYEILDKKNEPTGKTFEWVQSMKDEAFTKHPETGEPCKRAIVLPMVRHNGPAWEWCEDTRRYINTMKPKYIRDDKTGIRKRYPKGGV